MTPLLSPKISMSVPWYPVLVMKTLIVRTATGLTVAFAKRALMGMAQPARVSYYELINYEIKYCEFLLVLYLLFISFTLVFF